MNKYQQKIVKNIVSVFTVTILFVVIMINVRACLNRNETRLAMTQLGKIILEYKKQNGSLPSQATIESIASHVPGWARISNIEYRAPWINLDSPPGTILAYNDYVFKWLFVKKELVVLMLDGRVLVVDHRIFQQMLKAQQSAAEINEMQKAQHQKPDLP
jgi:hypothetical protein